MEELVENILENGYDEQRCKLRVCTRGGTTYRLKDWVFNEAETGIWGSLKKRKGRIFIPLSNVLFAEVEKENAD